MTSSLKLPVKKYRYFSKTKSKKKHDAKFTFKFLIKIPLLPVSLHFFFYLTCYCKISHSWIRILIQEGKMNEDPAPDFNVYCLIILSGQCWVQLFTIKKSASVSVCGC